MITAYILSDGGVVEKIKQRQVNYSLFVCREGLVRVNVYGLHTLWMRLAETSGENKSMTGELLIVCLQIRARAGQ
jgi:hypothetical protein